MILKLFTIFDSKIGAHVEQHFMQSRPQALRSWATTVNKAETMYAQHPGDFTFFEIGEFDTASGKFTAHPTPISLGTALEYKTQATGAQPLFDSLRRDGHTAAGGK